MPVYRNHTVVEIARGIKAFLRLEAGLARGAGSADTEDHSTVNPLNLLGGKGLATQPEPVKAAVRDLRREIRLAETLKESAKRFGTLKGEKGLKLHLGCGEDIRPGWVNIDFTPTPPPWTYPDATFINHDLRRGLPLEEGSCDFIYSSHFFEHLDYEEALQLMYDCHRVLSSGGVFRIVLPNLPDWFDAYLRGEKEYFDLLDAFLPESGTKTLIDYINYGVYQFGQHKYIYDEEKLELILRRIGYNSVSSSSYREGIDLDVPLRRRHSFYTEAVK